MSFLYKDTKISFENKISLKIFASKNVIRRSALYHPPPTATPVYHSCVTLYHVWSVKGYQNSNWLFSDLPLFTKIETSVALFCLRTPEEAKK